MRPANYESQTMAKLETVLRVFVASPSDVMDARKRLEKVVNELNYIWSRAIGVRLDLVKWETHAYSDIGKDAQAVINEQLDEFDIFLGIMWTRFGSPTSRAESGTVEEFNRAQERYRLDPRKVRLMFYFKEKPPAKLREIRPEDLVAVNKFKERVSSAGVFYRTYESLPDFEKITRLDLTRQVQEWGRSWGVVPDESISLKQFKLTEITGGKTEIVLELDKSIVQIVQEELGNYRKVRQNSGYDPEVVQLSFLEAQVILDSSPDRDDWGRLSVEQACALVSVALASRLERSEAAISLIREVCSRILQLRGLNIDWRDQSPSELFDLANDATDRHDDETLIWIRERTQDVGGN
jgi:Domain of unknown function (DUF4062)